MVARLGGDEFGVVTWTDSNEVALSRLTRDMKIAFNKPFIVEGTVTTHLSASIGTALYTTDGESLEALLKLADSRMFGLKRALRSQTQQGTA